MSTGSSAGSSIAPVPALVRGPGKGQAHDRRGGLLVIYPLIDLVASVIDARRQRGPARRLLRANAAVSALAAVALGVTATGSVADVLAVFGAWAGITGAAQLVVVLRRRAQLGSQWPLRLANGVSIVAGVAFVSAALAAPIPARAPVPPGRRRRLTSRRRRRSSLARVDVHQDERERGGDERGDADDAVTER